MRAPSSSPPRPPISDLSAPTDARPFFFNQLRLDRLFEQDVFALASRPGVYGGNLSATLTLAMLILISAASRRGDDHRSAALDREHGSAGRWSPPDPLLRPDRGRLHDGRDRPAPADQRVPGPPGLRLSVVLFSLILSTGLGSLASERIPLDSRARLIGWSALVGLYLFALPVWLPDVLLGSKAQACWSEPAVAFWSSRRRASSWASASRPECGWSRDRREADPLVLGHQRRGGRARCERCRADQHRVRHRYDRRAATSHYPPPRPAPPPWTQPPAPRRRPPQAQHGKKWTPSNEANHERKSRGKSTNKPKSALN